LIFAELQQRISLKSSAEDDAVWQGFQFGFMDDLFEFGKGFTLCFIFRIQQKFVW
jgi:hypothetical protein